GLCWSRQASTKHLKQQDRHRFEHATREAAQFVPPERVSVREVFPRPNGPVRPILVPAASAPYHSAIWLFAPLEDHDLRRNIGGVRGVMHATHIGRGPPAE